MELALPCDIGAYRVTERLAAGGFGVVYRAQDMQSGRSVALKVLDAERVADGDAITRFHREIRLAQLVRHANVVEILDVGEVRAGQPYFVMELLDGCDLGRFVRLRGRIAPGLLPRILEPLASALDAMHGKGIIHRDLKPSNVFLTGADLDRRVVLLDFGVAKLLDDTGPALTRSQHVIGTPHCMAPEQITGAQLGPPTDVYALGVLCYFMLTGVYPFDHADVDVVQSMHLTRPVSGPGHLVPVPHELDQLICRAMAKSPEHRPSSAGNFWAECRAILHRPEPACAASPRLGAHAELRLAVPEEEADDALLDRLEAILPRLRDALAALDVRVVAEHGNTLLAIGDPGAARVIAACAARVRASLDDARVEMRVRLHVATDAQLLGPAWTERDLAPGVFASAAAAASLGVISAVDWLQLDP
jgi:eukaryotic-like serine/threonine-protein kinase